MITPNNNSIIICSLKLLKFGVKVLILFHTFFQMFFDQRGVQLQIHHFDDVKGKEEWQPTNEIFDQYQRHV